MKSLLKMTLIGSAIVFALAGCDDKKAEKTTDTQPSTVQTTENGAADQSINIEVDPSKEAYAIGVSYANFLKFNAEKSDLNLDHKEVIKGFIDALNGQSKYNEQEIQFILTELGNRLNKEQQERLTAEKATSTAVGDKFRTEFAEQPDVKKTDSGLLYEVITPGTGPHPTAEDTVIVHYTGTLVDGTKFDSSYDRGEPTQFPLSSVIPGWTEGIQLIGTGGKIKLVIPPELAYGEQSPSPNIPVNSTLVFEVELLGINNDQAKQPTE
ncbi:FKBP-type peptidyl-prolyl cis-trans isomerase [Orbus mooreae]|uniref:FKBP-type peptidyl-prolyl cis-trans isomerase n=1 Tax=Orbus mooreae TaxID=3074107 RepID=UPI00370D154D